MSTYAERAEDARTEREREKMEDERRELWEFCAKTAAYRLCSRRGGRHIAGGAYHMTQHYPCAGARIEERLLAAEDEVFRLGKSHVLVERVNYQVHCTRCGYTYCPMDRRECPGCGLREG